MNAPKTDRQISIGAPEYLWDTAVETEVHRFVWPQLRLLLDRGRFKALLDIGCGNGALTARLATLVPECVGIDFSVSGIQIAREKYPTCKFLCASVESPLPSELHGRFDVVTAVEVVEHLLLPRQLFTRARQALKPGGHFMVTTPYHGYWKNLALAITARFDRHWHPLRDYGHIKFFSRRTLEHLFDEQGFTVDRFSRVGRIPPLARSMIMAGRYRPDGGQLR